MSRPGSRSARARSTNKRERAARHEPIGCPHQVGQVRALREASGLHVSRTTHDSIVTRRASTSTMRAELQHEEPARGMENSRMARSKRPYGSGCLLKRGKGGRFAGGSWRLLPTARGSGSCGSNRWARSRGSRPPKHSRSAWEPRGRAGDQLDHGSRSEPLQANRAHRSCRCTSTRRRSIGASC